MNKIYFKTLLYPLIFSFTLFFTLPYTIYFFNAADFNVKISHILYYSFFYFSISVLALSIMALFSKRVQGLVSAFCVLLTGYILICNFLLPIQEGLLDGIEHQNNSGNILSATNIEWIKFIGIGLFILIFYNFRQDIFKKFITYTSAISLMWVTYIIGNALFEEHLAPTEQKLEHFTNLSADQNILIISFDGLQGTFVNQVLRNSPELASEFDGFTFFEDTTSVAPATVLSTLTTLLGKVPGQDESHSLPAHLSESLTMDLVKKDIDVSCYSLPHQFEKGVKTANMFDFLSSEENYISSQLALNNLYMAAFSKMMPSYLQNAITQKLLSKTRRSPLTFQDELASDPHPCAPLSLTFLDFQSFKDALRKENQKKVFQFHHYNFSHDPVGFDQNCVYRASNKSPQTHEAMLGQVYCTLKSAATLLRKLKEIGAYNNSMIIFASDHGSEKAYQNSTFGDSPVPIPARESFGTRWSVSRYNAFLMFKDFKSTGSLNFSSRATSLLDIMPTVCSQYSTQKACTAQNFEGISLRDPAPANRERIILLTKGRDDNRDYSYSQKVKFRGSHSKAILDFYHPKINAGPAQTLSTLHLDLRNPIPEESGVILGLSAPTDHGSWSEGKYVLIRTKHALPEKFKFKFTASAFGPNAGKPFKIKAGNEVKEFLLTHQPKSHEFEFSNTTNTNTDIVFQIPMPTSPKELGQSSDQRKLGIHLIDVSIEKTARDTS